MTNSRFHEDQFFSALRDIFVGAEIEGESGFINLMRIKSRYYTEGVFPQLKQDIDVALEPFPQFREELFDKLFTFFQRYFSESGSIYFRYTHLHQNIYEKVYTDDRDVVLFWKTHMLYYVKTDRIFNSLKVEVDGVNFYFDASQIEHKRANEKRDVVFIFREVAPDDALVFDTAYSVRGRVTKIDEILRDLRNADIALPDETLEKAFRVFEKQSEVDFFINKNARAFLEEQFDLWMYQYLFKDRADVWSAERLAQLQVLKRTAYNVIGFISQFEDELVRIWNKPKFVRNSHYIITLDHFLQPGREDLLEKLFEHPGMEKQIEEWVNLGNLSENIRPQDLLDNLINRIVNEELSGGIFQYLALDTIFFSNIESKIITYFVNLDEGLDGWVIQSENYQALTSLKNKLFRQVNCIHIDPPYNTDTSGFLYTNNFQHSSWLTMMENRLSTSLGLLSKDGSLICHIDENEHEKLQVSSESLGINDYGTIIWDKRNPMLGKKGIATQHEYIIWKSNQKTSSYFTNTNILDILAKAKELSSKFPDSPNLAQEEFSAWLTNNKSLSGGEKAYRYLDENGNVFQSVSLGAPEKRTNKKFFKPLMHPITKKPCPVPPNGFSRTPETLQKMIERNEIIFGEDENKQPRKKVYLTKESKRQVSSVIQDSGRGKTDLDNLGLFFPYCHPVSLYETLTGATINQDEEIIMDFFAGSGTTAHAVMNLNREDGGTRKYILVEMGDHFHEVILPRIKKIAFNSKWKDGKPVFEEGESGISQFVKYYDLEQYEETLQKVHYEDADLFNDPDQDPYHSYVFLRDRKLLEAVELDHENDKVIFHPERLYPDIDLAETLSHLRGKWIKRITEDFVEFEDGEQMSLKEPDWETLKPMIWWR